MNFMLIIMITSSPWKGRKMKETIWVDQKTYLEIVEQLKEHGEVVIETREFPPISLKDGDK